MENYSNQMIDACAITFMHRIRQKYLKQQQQLTPLCLLLEEKLIYCSLIFSDKDKREPSNKNCYVQPIKQVIVQFIQKVNKIAIQTLEQAQTAQSPQYDKLLNKAIEMLMLPQIDKYLEDATLLKKLKILSFNNLSCLYKQKKKFGVAMRAIDFAVKLQEELVKTQANQQKYGIIPTYLNKAAVYSEMKKHHEAISIILLAKSYVQTIQTELTLQIQRTREQKQKKRLLQKRYYGMYMKMIIFYNLGAQKQHLKMVNQAAQFYKQSKQIAIIIDNQLMIAKLIPIIDSLMNGSK